MSSNLIRSTISRFDGVSASGGILAFLLKRWRRFLEAFPLCVVGKADLKEEFGLRDSFDGIFTSADIGYRKAERAFWEAVHERLGKPEKRGIMVWDDDEESVQAAKSFGFQGALYTDFASYARQMESL